MSGIRTAVAIVIATAACGGVLVRAAQQQPARGATAAPAPARGGTQTAAPAPSTAAPRGAAPAPQQSGQGQTPSQFPLSQTIRDRGTSITGSFEGWFPGKDGNDYALVGYFNRNTKQEVEIPVGPNNKIEPGGPDQGQPTHFYTGRQRGIFAVKLPKDLGKKRLAWTITANGFTNTITLHKEPTYIVEPYLLAGSNTTPPTLKFDPSGASFQGPPIGIAATLTTTMPAPLTLTTYVTPGAGGRGGGGGGGAAGGGAPGGGGGRGGGRGAPAPAAGAEPASPDAAAVADQPPAARGGGGGGRGAAGGGGGRGGRGGGGAAGAAAGGAGAAGAAQARGGAGGGAGAAGAAAAAAAAGGGGGRGGGGGAQWSKMRGPGTVTFAAVAQAGGAAGDGKSQTTATFDAPGDYLLRVQIGAANAEFCCWTNANVAVSVKPAAGSK